MGAKRSSYQRQRLGLAAAHPIVWIALAIEPSDRFDWALIGARPTTGFGPVLSPAVTLS